MTTDSQFVSLEERCAQLRAKAIAAGVRLVSETELAAVNRAREERIKAARLRRTSTRRIAPGNSGAVRSSCPPERDIEVGPPSPAGGYDAVNGLGHSGAVAQDEFNEGGYAATQNEILIGFFSDPKTHGKLFPMVYLEEISGAKRMNNRARDLREHFRPLGLGIWNEQRIWEHDGERTMHSHYGIFTLGQIAVMESERLAAREKRTGQQVLET